MLGGRWGRLMAEDTKFWVTIIATFFGGGIVGWLVTKLEEWWVAPHIVIEYGPGIPLR